MASTTAVHHPPTAPPPANDELDDLFGCNVNLDDVFRDVDTNMRAPEQPSQPSKDKNNIGRQVDSLGIDEAVKVEKKRAPVAKLDEARYHELSTAAYSDWRAELVLGFSRRRGYRS